MQKKAGKEIGGEAGCYDSSIMRGRMSHGNCGSPKGGEASREESWGA